MSGDRWMRVLEDDSYVIPDWWVFSPEYQVNELELGWRAAVWLEEAVLGQAIAEVVARG